jgi:Asp-tRNA(Asn)/Glu-tRNA(Gln) amidotransferase A subunit family amidase
MDKLGPICRSVEDCAIVLDAIYGPDGHDRSVRTVAFNWNAQLDWRGLRIGYLKADFEHGPQPGTPLMPPAADTALSADERKRREDEQHQQEAIRAHAAYDRRFDDAALTKLASMGVTLVPVELPPLPWTSISPLLQAEAKLRQRSTSSRARGATSC